MIHVEYIGSSTVRFDGRDYVYGPFDRGGVMPKFAREMIKQGMDPETPVRVSRVGTFVYSQDWSLSHWAKKSYSEDGHPTLRERNYRPFSGSV